MNVENLFDDNRSIVQIANLFSLTLLIILHSGVLIHNFTMAQIENIKLTWDQFQDCATFKDIYQETNFLDVTLASEDHRQIKAHRVVLSASSPFFKYVLANVLHPHPFLYLKGIEFKDLDVLIRFIYFGEAEVPKEDLSRLLLVASELQVKGLCDQPNNNPENPDKY